MKLNEFDTDKVHFKGIIEKLFPIGYLPHTGDSSKLICQIIVLKSSFDFFEIEFIGNDVDFLKPCKEGQLAEIQGKLVGKKWDGSNGQIRYFTKIKGKSYKIIENKNLELKFETDKLHFKGIIEKLFPIRGLPNTDYSFDVIVQVVVLKSGFNLFEIQFVGKSVDLLKLCKEGQSVEIYGKLLGKQWTDSNGQRKYFTNINGKNFKITAASLEVIDSIIDSPKECEIKQNIPPEIKKISEQVDYYKNGNIASKCTLINGKKEGEWIGYFESGNIDTKRSYVRGKIHGWSISFFESGQIRSKREYVNGKKNGERSAYYENGQISYRVNITDDKFEGELISYYKSGKTKKVQNFSNGMMNGELIEYYENGQVLCLAEYENDKAVKYILFNEKGKKVNSLP